MLKKHLYKEFILWKKVHYSAIWGSLPHSKFVTDYLNENAPDYIRKENWSPDFCEPNLLGYSIWGIMKKILYKNLRRYEDIECLSAAMSHAWDRQTKNFINNSIDQWRMRLKKVVEEVGGHILHLIWQHRLMILRKFL